MITVDEVHIREAGRPKQNRIAQRIPSRRVRRRVILPQVRLHFYNPAGKRYAPLLSQQNLPQEFAAHAPRNDHE